MSFPISSRVLQAYPDIIELLKGSKSLPESEKDYWLEALETMDASQVESLRKILTDEKIQLQKIHDDEVAKTQKIVSVEEIRIAEEKQKAKIAQIKAQESTSKKSDEEELASLLSSVDTL